MMTPPISAQHFPPYYRMDGDMAPSKMKQIAIVIVQMAVRLLFIVGSVLMTGAYLPAAAVSVAAVGATFLSSFFFPKVTAIDPPYFAPREPLIRPFAPRDVAPPIPVELIREAPPGCYREGQNCAFNSLIHFLQAEPALAEWFRHPLPDNLDLPAFENFIAGYHPSTRLINEFRDYVRAQAEPRPDIFLLFRNFLHGHPRDPDNAYRAELMDMKDVIDALLLIRGPLADLFAAYDRAVAENRVFMASQNFRLAVHPISPINVRTGEPAIPASSHVQVDAHEVLMALFKIVPDPYKMRVRQTNTYEMGNHPISANPTGVTQKEERIAFIDLTIPEGEANLTLESLLRRYCDAREVRELRSATDGQNRSYPAVIERRFLEMPPVLRFRIERFHYKELPKSWLTNILSSIWPNLGHRDVKIETPVQIPDTLAIADANGERRQYRLASVVYHQGSTPTSGHYTASRRINGREYYMNDDRVTLGDQRPGGALPSLLCYVPVPA